MSTNSEMREGRASLSDIVEEIRAKRYPHLDSALVKEVLDLHSDPEAMVQGLRSAMDEIIAKHCGGSA